MKYYVVADVHGFYTELRTELESKGFFSDDPKERKLVVCGDLFDRGTEAKKLQEFILELMDRDEVILIRGNHEDLIESLLWDTVYWMGDAMFYSHHQSNGTVNTLLQLTDSTQDDVLHQPDHVRQAFRKSPFYQRILPSMVDFYETKNYIFVHGWIPTDRSSTKHEYVPDWRSSEYMSWKVARWTNGMVAAHDGAIEEEKTIVCGHWHCSFGHARYEGKGEEFGETADYSPYYASGIIAIDACTVRSKRVNCLVIED